MRPRLAAGAAAGGGGGVGRGGGGGGGAGGFGMLAEGSMPINQSAISLCGWHLKISAILLRGENGGGVPGAQTGSSDRFL